MSTTTSDRTLDGIPQRFTHGRRQEGEQQYIAARCLERSRDGKPANALTFISICCATMQCITNGGASAPAHGYKRSQRGAELLPRSVVVRKFQRGCCAQFGSESRNRCCDISRDSTGG